MSVAECFRRVAAQVEAAASARAASAAAAATGSASGGSGAASGVRLVAVSKLHALPALAEAHGAGARAFGENYVAEALSKAGALAALRPRARLHYVGTLQSNKARALVAGCGGVLWAVESVDSPRLATLLQRAAAESRPPPPAAPPLRVFVQVNVSGEAAKGGVPPGGAAALARFIVDACPALRLQGLMTIGAADAPPRQAFERLAAERAAVVAALDAAGVPRARYGPARLPGDDDEDGGGGGGGGGSGGQPPPACELELSMGMSADYELAIACGSTSVRVGSAIFGERVKGGGAAAPTDAEAPLSDAGGSARAR
jgi:pyridoxal phosphate enzyme (YggS family)